MFVKYKRKCYSVNFLKFLGTKQGTIAYALSLWKKKKGGGDLSCVHRTQCSVEQQSSAQETPW